MVGTIKKFQCPVCQGVVATELNDDYVICGHCESACQVPEPFSPGWVIDDFVIVNMLGEGGMGNVYLAHQFTLDRKVALKILKESFLRDPKFKEEFLYEARSVASLNHPNIIQAYKVGEEDGVVFFAMEYVEGRNLKDILKEEGTISEKFVLSIAVEIVEALGYGWKTRQLVHRDIKPENIMISSDGTAKLMDLGLSLRDGDNKDDGDTIAGTPQYISPEQVLGTDMDIRGDFYCLGATLYHLVSGKMPFEGTLQEIVKQHLSEKPPSLRKVAPGVNDLFAKIIHRMMAKKPENRYESADALLADLRKDIQMLKDAEQGKKHFRISTQTNILTNTGTSEFSKRRKKKDPVLLASVVMLGLLLGGFLIVKMVLSAGSSQPAPKTVEKTSNKKTGTSGSSVAVSSNYSNDFIPQQGLTYKYYHVKDIKADNPFTSVKLVESGITDKLFNTAPDGKKDHYVIIFDGFIDIKFTESYKFYVQGDDKCHLNIDGNWIRGGGDGVSKLIPLNKGVYPIAIYYHQHTRNKSLNIHVESISFNKQKLPVDWLMVTPGPKELAYDKSKPGISYKLYKNQDNYHSTLRYFADEEGVMSKPKLYENSILDNSYVIDFDGLLKVPKPGTYTFYLSGNNRKTLTVNGIKMIEKDFREKTASSKVVFNNTMNMIALRSFIKGEDPVLKLEIEGEGLERQEVPQSWYFQQLNSSYWERVHKKEVSAVRNEQVQGRLNYKYFDSKIKTLESMRKKTSTSNGSIDNLVSRKGKKNENFSLYFYGSINIPGNDTYTFTLDSDDHSLLVIDGKNVTTDDSGSRDGSGSVNLTRGKHKFELFFNQGVGGHRLELYVQSSRLPKIKVPSSWYSTEESDGPVERSTTPKTEPPKKAPPRRRAGKAKGQLKYNYYETAYKDDVADIIADPVKSSGLEPDLNFKKGKRDEFYGLYYHGFITIPKREEYTFYLAADDVALLKIGGSELIRAKVQDGVGVAKKVLKEGKHKFEVFYYQVSQTGHLNLHVESKSIKKQKVPSSWYSVSRESLSELIKPVATEIDNSFESGLRYTLHKSGTEVKKMDEMLANKTLKKDVVCRYFKCDAHAGSHDKNYGLVYEGYFYSDVDQTQTFGLTSNDGSRLFLGDQLVIDHDGTHEASEKTVTLDLKKGLYKFRLEYFQQLMSRELKLSWKNKSGQMVPVQEKFFYRKKDISVENNAPEGALNQKVSPMEKVVSTGKDLTIDPLVLRNETFKTQGLKYTLYKSASKNLNSINEALASKKIKENQIADDIYPLWHTHGHKNNYGLVYESYLRITRDGPQEFLLQSNDGSRFYLNDQLIIDNDTNRDSKQGKTRTVNLKKGLYKFRMEYYQDNRGQFLLLQWKNTAGKMNKIPKGRFRLQD